MESINIKNLKHIHFTGIKGVGMTSLALCAKDLGIKVTGSDVEEYFVTDETLARRKIKWNVGFRKENLKPVPDLLITTGAHGGLENPEVVVAKTLNIPVMTLSEAQGLFSKDKVTIAVCGVGGKTTTCSMIATLLFEADLNPSFAIGVGNIYPLDTPGKYDKKGKHFICEADEFAVSPGIDNRPRFTFLLPKIIVVTNIEHDHPDIYPTIKDTKKVFMQFLKKIPGNGVLIACVDNKNVCDIIKNLEVNVITYGFSDKADCQIKNIGFKEGITLFDIYIKKEKKIIKNIKINVPGGFNIKNALAAFIVGRFLNIDVGILKKGIAKYSGCRRRFEKMKEEDGIVFYDDYAHHPIEVKSTLKAARGWYPNNKIIVIFQPHTYSRTKTLLHEFSNAFTQADVVAVMDIYASAREKIDKSISSKVLVQEIQKYHKNVFYTANHKDTLQWIKENVDKKDIVITMGAGDIFHLYS